MLQNRPGRDTGTEHAGPSAVAGKVFGECYRRDEFGADHVRHVIPDSLCPTGSGFLDDGVEPSD